jgi:hypothetical protein
MPKSSAQENYAMIKPNVGPEVAEALQLGDVARNSVALV